MKSLKWDYSGFEIFKNNMNGRGGIGDEMRRYVEEDHLEEQGDRIQALKG